MSGHETPQERQEIERRESRVDPARSPIAEVLELAAMYLEPAHREIDAIRLYEAALARDPTNGEAGLWLAHTLLHVIMDRPALARAREILMPLLAHPTFVGAAALLLAHVREEQGAPLEERRGLLELSVAREPGWVGNRQDLARAYFEENRREEAVAQLHRALANTIAADPAWTAARRNFEESITGRAGFGAQERLQADLEEMAGKR